MKLLKSLLTILALALPYLCYSLWFSEMLLSGKTTAKLALLRKSKSGNFESLYSETRNLGYVDSDGLYQGYDIELEISWQRPHVSKYVSVDAANRANDF